MEPRPLEILSKYENIVHFLPSYLESRAGLRVSVAMVTASDHPDHDSEILFHQQRLGNLATLVPRSADLSSNYLLTEQSNILVSLTSTLGLENLARGRKTFMCSTFCAAVFADKPFTPDWLLRSKDQDAFNEAITRLLGMSRHDFLSTNH